mgnify:CR=1 FL=1
MAENNNQVAPVYGVAKSFDKKGRKYSLKISFKRYLKLSLIIIWAAPVFGTNHIFVGRDTLL